jgi:hypothetical protein
MGDGIAASPKLVVFNLSSLTFFLLSFGDALRAMSRDSRARLCRVLPGRRRQGDLRFLCGFGILPDSTPDCEGNPRLSSADCCWPCKAAKGNERGSEA